MYRIIACDLDGTLLRDDKTISEETRNLLEELTGKGVIFLPSTGRTHRELPPALKGQPFIHYALCCNGGAVYDYRQEKYIFEDAIPYQTAVELLEYIKKLPVYETVVVNGERIVKGDENNEISEYIKKVAVKGLIFNFQGAYDVAEAFAKRHQDAQKLMLYLAEGADRQSVMDELASKFPQLLISSSGPVYIEVNIKGVDKGKALRRFCELMNVPIEESIAFGDAENDISMLDAAGIGVVMANGSSETKKHADLICPSNMDEGVRKTLEDIWK